MIKWISAGRGIRYREHASRKHGRRPDRYWCIRYKLNGKDRDEAVGWWSQGVTQARCSEILAALRQNQRSALGPQTWKEMREAQLESQAAEAAAEEAGQEGPLTVGEFWPRHIDRLSLTATPASVNGAQSYMRTWLMVLADMPLADIKTDDLERLVVRPMLEDGKSPGSIERALAVFSSLWRDAWRQGLVSGNNPKSKVRKPRLDNQRDRFLSQTEAARLLEALKERSIVAHDMAVLALFSGLRARECLKLTWADIDFDNGLIFVKHTKNKHNRHAHMTAEIRAMLLRRAPWRDKPDKVFVGPELGESYCSIMPHFKLTVDKIGLNDGISDRRQKVVFHTLRHTFASWLVMMGKPLYTISKLMGHRNIRWTERYAHLAPGAQKAAALKLEGFLN